MMWYKLFFQTETKKLRFYSFVFPLLIISLFTILSCQTRSPLKRTIDSGSAPVPNRAIYPEVLLSSDTVTNGSVFSVDVVLKNTEGSTNETKEPTGTLGLKKLSFIPISSNRWKAIIPIDFMQKPAVQVISVKHPGYVNWIFQSEIKMIEGDYPKEHLKVAPRHVSPSAKDLKRIRSEQVVLNKIYAEKTPEVFWTTAYQIPVDSAVTSPYGVKRIYNGKLNGYHRGLDLRAPLGTPIHAPKKGKVVLTKDLFYTGNTVFLDHGWGVYTIYAHMSGITVKEGQIVEVGDQLGVSGSTGRSTGPHLHWGASIGSTKVNPPDLMKALQ